MLRKDVETSWTEDCLKAFDKIKEYLSTLLVLVLPEPGRPLLLYLSILDGALGCVLGQHDETRRKEQAIYYLREDITETYDDWMMFFDGAANFKGVGIGAVLVSEVRQHYPISAKLRFPCTNNMAEYEAWILGLNMAIGMNVQELLVPPNELNSTSLPWPFAAWGMDVIGPVEPTASNRHRFILVAIHYFTKWVEAASYKVVTKKVVADFVKDRIVYRFGVPESIITNNASNINSDLMKAICEAFKNKHRIPPPTDLR
ncbi:uncharacterized protein [Nicotiana sylvestris]|uniref:uncharacterized protein n=1 Tax=Nicotiana sylvestris TaxID=4096 RepID=UPI00388CB465